MDKKNTNRSADNKSLFERAKALIDDFCLSEYGSAGEYEDLTSIPIGYTTITDEEIPIQIYVDLVNFAIRRELDFEPLDETRYDTLEQLISNELEWLDFHALITVGDAVLTERGYTVPF